MSRASHVHSADTTGPSPILGQAAPVMPIEEARCALCGSSLVGKKQRFRMVSPLVTMGKVTVCRTCRRAALSEGYRAAD
jgi:hypothetical protein